METDKAIKILRSSIHLLFCNYKTFVCHTIILIFPASAAALLSSSSSSWSSLLLAVASRLRPPFDLENFSLDSCLLGFLKIKIVSFFFALTFLDLSKASAICVVREHPRCRDFPPSFPSILRLYPSLLRTHLFSAFFLFSMLIMALVCLQIPAPMLSGATFALCSVAMVASEAVGKIAGVVSAMENCGGCNAMLRALSLLGGRSTAAVGLPLALLSNLGMAAIEVLFKIRVMRIYRRKGDLDLSLLCEGFVVVWMYSIASLLDVIISCCFYESCCRHGLREEYGFREFEPEEKVRALV